MKKYFTVIWITIIILVVAGFEAQAQIPDRISFQGKLMTVNGQPFNGTKNMTFTVGTYSKQMNVPVINGLYSVTLEVPDSVFKGTTPSLNIKVDGNDLTPNTEFNSVPYTYMSRYSDNSGKLDGKPANHYVQTLSIDSNKISISNGNTITLPDQVGNDVLQDLNFFRDTLKITQNPNATKVVLNRYRQDLNLLSDTLRITENDSATAIDLKQYRQTLSLNTGRLSISGGNTVDLTFVEQDPKVGALTTNYIPKWNADKLENSFIYSDNGRIGVGTITPSSRLQAEAAQPIKAFAAYNNYSSGGGAEIGVTLGTNNDPALRVFTQGTGYAGDFNINNNTSSATALNVNNNGTGAAGKFSANTSFSALEVTNINSNPGSYAVKATSPSCAVYGTTVSGKALEGVATATGTGVYGYSENSIAGIFQSGNSTAFSLKCDGNYWVTSNTRFDGYVGMGGNWDIGYRLFVYGSAYATGFWQSSDANLKNNIRPIGSALSKVSMLQGVQYDWNEPAKYGEGSQIGFLAQDMQKVFPELVKSTQNGYAIQYAPLTAVLVEAVKEVNQKNEQLSAEVGILRQLVLQLQSKIDNMAGSK